MRGSYTVTGANAFELADRATAAVASDLGLSSGALHLADVTTSSLVAYRFYEEGLRSYARADYRGAIRLFDAAFAEDSRFAMAAHYAMRARQAVNVPVPVAFRDSVLRLADGASDRERLLIRGTWAPSMATPAVAAIAETLAIRYPAEPDGHLLLGTARSWSGDFLGAIPHLRRVVTMDSLALLGTHANCRACEALYALVNAYILADSLPAAERVARQWVRLQPGSGRAWHQLATALEYQDRVEALDARRNAMTLSPGHPYDALNPAIFHIRAGGFASADRLLTELARDAQPDVQSEALWFLTISLRNQGRLREALATAARLENAGRQLASGEATTSGGNPAQALLELPRGSSGPSAWVPSGGHRAQVLLELGRAREAEAIFRALGSIAATADYLPTTMARHRSWYLTHRAGALAALGDTATLALLADSIEWWGSLSTYGRDQRLHQHVRGLLLVARGQPTLAVRAFERAIYSRTVGYTRTNLELARVLISLHRPGDAVRLLQSALRGGLEANNLYVTRTELQYLLGRAWDAAGRADSAAAQYRRVLAAWRAADPQFHARRDSIRNRLVALGKQD
jgi:tetratricopeptide (TPR) repeat protein